jgi:hypothetical protein
VKPAKGRAVRDPATLALLPEEGRNVPDNDPFWRRRLRDGDVVRADEEQRRQPARQHPEHRS